MKTLLFTTYIAIAVFFIATTYHDEEKWYIKILLYLASLLWPITFILLLISISFENLTQRDYENT